MRQPQLLCSRVPQAPAIALCVWSGHTVGRLSVAPSSFCLGITVWVEEKEGEEGGGKQTASGLLSRNTHLRAWLHHHPTPLQHLIHMVLCTAYAC